AVIPNVFNDFKFVPGMEFFIHQWWAIAQLRVKDAIVHKDSIELYFFQPESKIQSEHPWPKPWLSKESGNSAFRLVNALQFLDKESVNSACRLVNVLQLLDKPGE